MRMYKVGFYFNLRSLPYFAQEAARKGCRIDGDKYYQDNLYPMSHKEAMTFISKMSNPANHFVYEV